MSAIPFESEWLVEIRLKDWIPTPAGQGRTVAYEQVLAHDEIAARMAGFDQFATRCKFEPIMRRRMEMLNLTPSQCCAPDAVAL